MRTAQRTSETTFAACRSMSIISCIIYLTVANIIQSMHAVIDVHACTHTRTHAHTHARLHAHTHTHMHARTHAHTHTHARPVSSCGQSKTVSCTHREKEGILRLQMFRQRKMDIHRRPRCTMHYTYVRESTLYMQHICYPPSGVTNTVFLFPPRTHVYSPASAQENPFLMRRCVTFPFLRATL